MKTKKSYVTGVDIDTFTMFDEAMPKKITKDTYLQLYKSEEWMSSCIEAIVYACVSSGYHLTPRYKDEIDDFYYSLIKRFFDNINEEDMLDDLLFSTCFDLLVYGNAFWELVEDVGLYLEFNEIIARQNINEIFQVKFPFRYYRIPPLNVNIYFKNNEKRFKLKVGKGEFKDIEADSIIHFKFFSPLADIEGIPPSETLSNVIAAIIFANEYNVKFFENNATPRLHIDLGYVSKTALNEFIGMAEKRLKGKPQANIITRGNAKVTPITWRNIDMEFVRYLEYLRDKILAKFKVPPLILGIMDRGANPEAQIALFKTLAIEPIHKIISSRINKKILQRHFPDVDLWFEFNAVDNLDRQAQTNVEATELSNLITTINEVRTRRGQKRVPWGYTPVIPYTDISKAILKSPKTNKENG